MHRFFIIMSVLLLVGITGCTESLDLQLEPEVSVFFSNDSDKERRLTADDKEYAVLNEWLRENRSGWYSTTGRYPGGVYIASGSHGIQVTETKVIIYSTAKSEPQAIYVRTLDKGDLSGVRSVGE